MQAMYNAAGSREGEVNRKILTALSMNGRISVPHLERIMGIDGVDTHARIKKLENELGIKYTAVIDLGKLGLDEYLAFIRFTDRMPGPDEIKVDLQNSPYVQCAMATTGSFDLLVYFLVEKCMSSAAAINALRNSIFKEYNTSWRVTPFYKSFGHIPLRDRFFDSIIKKRIWHRENGRAEKKPWSLAYREYAVLRELCIDGNTEFNSIDDKYGFDRGRSQYTYHQLKSDGIIGRITIDMRALPVRHSLITRVEKLNLHGAAMLPRALLSQLSDNTGITDRYSLIGEIHAPDGVLVVAPIISGGEAAIRSALNDINGTRSDTSIATSAIVGCICMRRFDAAHLGMHLGCGAKMAKGVISYDTSKKEDGKRRDIRGIEKEDSIDA